MKKYPTKDNRLICTTFNNKLTLLLRNRDKEYTEDQYSLTIEINQSHGK